MSGTLTPARLKVGRAGPRYTTRAWLKFRADHARAVDAVMTEVSPGWARRHSIFEVSSCAASREQFLLKPELGRRLSASSVAALKRRLLSGRSRAGRQVVICVGDGLSSAAIEAHGAELIGALMRGLSRKYNVAPPIFVRNARVRIQDHIGEVLRPGVVCMLIGERPGLASAESLSAYVIWRPTLKSREPDRTVISNIQPRGLKIGRAVERISKLIDCVMTYRASGAALAEWRTRKRLS